MLETVVSVTFMQMEVVVEFSTLYILRQIRCAVVVEEDSKWIWEPTNKLGTRQLRIVTRTREMDRWIKIKIRVRFIIGMISPHVQVMTTTITLLQKCVVLVEVEKREFVRTRTTEPLTLSELPVSIWLLETAMALELVLILKPVVLFWITFSSRPPKCVALVVVDEQFLPTRKATCQHGSGGLDSEGDSCTDYRKYNLGVGCAGAFDDVDFTAREMCCGCSGGYSLLCAATNHDLVDAANNTCSSYLSPDDCDGQLDTSNFTAQELCCGCGGGFQWFTNEIQNRSTTFECFDLPSNSANVSSCSQYDQDSSTCGMYVCVFENSLCSPLFLI